MVAGMLSLVLVLCMFSAFEAQAGRLYGVRTGEMLGMNNVQLAAALDYTNLHEGEIALYSFIVDYGVAPFLDFSASLEFASVPGAESSFILGDPEFSLLFSIKEWASFEDLSRSVLFGYVGFSIGLGVVEGDGVYNPSIGATQQYYPFVKGLGEFYLGAGYTMDRHPYALHLNFEWCAASRGIENPFSFNFLNDYIDLAAAVDYYASFQLSRKLDLAIRPFYEMRLRLSWDESAAYPRAMRNTLGLWLRVGPLFRIRAGIGGELPLDSRKLIRSVYFLQLSFLFR